MVEYLLESLPTIRVPPSIWQEDASYSSSKQGPEILQQWSPTWSSTEPVARPATKRFHPSDWKPVEVCCRPWTWWCNDATALAGYANMMMTMMMIRGLGDEGFLLPGVYVRLSLAGIVSKRLDRSSWFCGMEAFFHLSNTVS